MPGVIVLRQSWLTLWRKFDGSDRVLGSWKHMSSNIVRFKLAKYRGVEDMLAERCFGDGNDATRRGVIDFWLFYARRAPISRREANQRQIFREQLSINQAFCDKLESFAV